MQEPKVKYRELSASEHIGEKYAMLTLSSVIPSKRGMKYYICTCECGGKRNVRLCDLRRGHTKSCGCKTFDRSDTINLNSKWNYTQVHKWILGHYGNASECCNINCEKKPTKRYEWALIKGRKYERDIDNFMPLCVSCHRRYDTTPEQRQALGRMGGLSNFQPGLPVLKLHPKTLEVLERFDNANFASKAVGRNRTAIWRAVNNPEFTCAKFKWSYEKR